VINFAGFLKLNKMNRVISTILVIAAIAILVYHNNSNSDRIIDEIRNNKCIDLEKRLEAITAKKNTLFLIALERGKKRPNRDYLDSLEVDYELR